MYCEVSLFKQLRPLQLQRQPRVKIHFLGFFSFHNFFYLLSKKLQQQQCQQEVHKCNLEKH
jgi:hypothetical protein